MGCLVRGVYGGGEGSIVFQGPLEGHHINVTMCPLFSQWLNDLLALFILL